VTALNGVAFSPEESTTLDGRSGACICGGESEVESSNSAVCRSKAIPEPSLESLSVDRLTKVGIFNVSTPPLFLAVSRVAHPNDDDADAKLDSTLVAYLTVSASEIEFTRGSNFKFKPTTTHTYARLMYCSGCGLCIVPSTHSN
jgi:hypothetical protein